MQEIAEILDVMYRDIPLSEKRDVIDVLLYERRIRVGDLVDALDQFVEVKDGGKSDPAS